MKTEHLSGIFTIAGKKMKINALPRRPQEGSRSPGTGDTGLCEQFCGFKELNLVLPAQEK